MLYATLVNSNRDGSSFTTDLTRLRLGRVLLLLSLLRDRCLFLHDAHDFVGFGQECIQDALAFGNRSVRGGEDAVFPELVNLRERKLVRLMVSE